MSSVVLFNKPFRVLCQFSPSGDKATLADYIDITNVYPAGRLDFDSEGLLVLTDDGKLQSRIANPRHKQVKKYLAQVEGCPSPETLDNLRRGVMLKDGRTQPATVTAVDQPEGLWPREPPIRYRANIPTHWVKLEIREGKNRQVRRMTAAVGHPTLRLIRTDVGQWSVAGLAPGECKVMSL
ncbi:MAG: pseudouridine synthase [Lysobacterales bacterium]